VTAKEIRKEGKASSGKKFVEKRPIKRKKERSCNVQSTRTTSFNKNRDYDTGNQDLREQKAHLPQGLSKEGILRGSSSRRRGGNSSVNT